MAQKQTTKNEGTLFQETLDEVLEKGMKDGTIKFNPDLEQVGFCTSFQPKLFWQPTRDGSHFECTICGMRATHFAQSKKIFRCEKCLLKPTEA